MSEKFSKSQLNSFKYASEKTGKPITDFYNPETGNIKKVFKDFVKANPSECRPIVQTVVKRCMPLFDDLIAGKISPKDFGEKCLTKKEEIREEGYCYRHPEEGMPKGLKEYREKSEKVKTEMRKTGIINSK